MTSNAGRLLQSSTRRGCDRPHLCLRDHSESAFVRRLYGSARREFGGEQTPARSFSGSTGSAWRVSAYCPSSNSVILSIATPAAKLARRRSRLDRAFGEPPLAHSRRPLAPPGAQKTRAMFRGAAALRYPEQSRAFSTISFQQDAPLILVTTNVVLIMPEVRQQADLNCLRVR